MVKVNKKNLSKVDDEKCSFYVELSTKFDAINSTHLQTLKFQ